MGDQGYPFKSMTRIMVCLFSKMYDALILSRAKAISLLKHTRTHGPAACPFSGLFYFFTPFVPAILATLFFLSLTF